MSKQQWGHGYHAGYKSGQIDAKTQQIFEEDPDAHWVPAQYFGSEGIEPTEPALCHGKAEWSCVSGGGGSACSGFAGMHKNGRYALCLLPIPAKKWDGV